MSQFRLEVWYIEGEGNIVADAMSTWAYLAPQAGGDEAMLGTLYNCDVMDASLSDKKTGGERECNHSGCTVGG